MRGLYLVAVFMAVLLATAFAGNVEHRSLRAVEDDTTEERGIRDSLQNKLQHVDAKLRTKFEEGKAKLVHPIKVIKQDIRVYKALKDGENHDDILTSMGAKFTHTDYYGNKVFSEKDPIWIRFDRLRQIYNLRHPL